MIPRTGEELIGYNIGQSERDALAIANSDLRSENKMLKDKIKDLEDCIKDLYSEITF